MMTSRTTRKRPREGEQARRLWAEASAEQLVELLSLTPAERAALPEKSLLGLTDTDRALFLQRLSKDSYQAGREEAMAAVIDRWFTATVGRWQEWIVGLRRRREGRRAAAEATSAEVVIDAAEDEVSWAAVGVEGPSWGERAAGVAEAVLGTAWEPVRWLVLKTWVWWPIPLSIAASGFLATWLTAPPFADPLRWSAMVGSLSPAFVWLLYVAFCTALNGDIRRPQTVCAVLQIIAAIPPLWREIGNMAAATAEYYDALPEATLLWKAGTWVGAAISAVVQRADPYTWTLVAVAGLLAYAWYRDAPKATGTPD